MPHAACLPALAAAAILAAVASAAAQAPACPVTHEALVNALRGSVKPSGGPTNGGFDNHVWAAVMTRDGTVCAVAFSGATADDQWPGSRAIAAEKANTANALSVKGMALSTANLYAGTIPGGPFYGLEETSPVSGEVISAGDPATYGMPNDPMVGKKPGGVVVFGGGLALYDVTDIKGGLGVSGDSSCADHNVAWRVRAALNLDAVPAGVAGDRKDAIIYDLDHENKSASGFGHPQCIGEEGRVANEIGAAVGGEVIQ